MFYIADLCFLFYSFSAFATSAIYNNSCVCMNILWCTGVCVSWCFASMSLHPVKGLYQKKSRLELGTETGLRIKNRLRDTTHTWQCVHSNTLYCTVHATVFLETESRGMERGDGGARSWSLLHCEWVWVGGYAPCRTSNSSKARGVQRRHV